MVTLASKHTLVQDRLNSAGVGHGLDRGELLHPTAPWLLDGKLGIPIETPLAGPD